MNEAFLPERKWEVETKVCLEHGVLLVHVVFLVVSWILAQVTRLENDDQHRQTKT